MHSQFGIFSQPCFNRIFSYCLSTIGLPKDDRTDSVQEERLGLPYWTMILAICVVVDESKCLDTPISEFSIICEHLPFLLGYKPILRLLLVHRKQAICRGIISYTSYSRTNDYVKLWLRHCVQLYAQQHHA